MYYAISLSMQNEDNPQDFIYTDYCQFFEKFGIKLIYLPNISDNIETYFADLSVKGIILSGGNDLSPEFTGQTAVDIRNPAPKRDETEKRLLDLAVKQKIPVLGICRGMQFINCYFGGSITQNIEPKKNKEKLHVQNSHLITIGDEKMVGVFGKKEFKVNSFHHQGIHQEQVASYLKVMALCSEDKLVEALYHPLLPIAGIQWHPERKGSSIEYDSNLMEAFINNLLCWEKK